uniref:ABC transporter F family member 4-like n=1 Tax=Nicotiana tabacum TaxID=4097 RepID=A0A1S4A8J9_TOBAC|nr:PREDICTED: ABC transporter F family member 4-like [Nicotiana tabacum]
MAESSPTPVGLTEEIGAMKSSGVIIPGIARANKKRKAASFIPVKTPPARGRATRSQKKQSEAELEKALEESKRKVVTKGKKKVVEPVEAVEIEEIDLVLRDENKAEEEEVATPKIKKIKTFKKKSPSKTKSAEPSTLAKRTRSDVKSRKVKVVEEEESEEEEEEEVEDETDEEQDKKEKFGKRTILKGRLLRDLEEEGMVMLLQKLQLQGWKDMVLQMDGRLARADIVEFMANCEIKNGNHQCGEGSDCEL